MMNSELCSIESEDPSEIIDEKLINETNTSAIYFKKDSCVASFSSLNVFEVMRSKFELSKWNPAELQFKCFRLEPKEIKFSSS